MPNGFENFANTAQALGERWHQQRQQQRMSQALATYDTDPEGAANKAIGVDPVFGANLLNNVKANALATANADHSRQHQALGDLITYLRPAAQDPNATPDTLGKAYDSLTPIMAGALGMKPSEIASWRSTFINNPGMLDDLAAHAKDIQAGAPGTVFFDKRLGHPVYTVPQPDKIVPTKDGNVITVPQTYNGQPGGGPAVSAAGGAQPQAAPASSAVPPPGSPQRKALYDAIAMQETSNTPGKLGPPTKYGRAAGIMGTMPGTAQEMALKLGLPWRPDAMTATDPASEAYQRALGQAYFDEGLDKTGNVRDALHYYYSGSTDPKKWGPNTRAYPGQVANRMDSSTASQFGLTGGGAGGGAPAAGGPAGSHVVYTAPASATEKGWRQLTQDEVASKGLDPRVAWQTGTGGTHDGEIKMVGPAALLNPKNNPQTNSADNASRLDTVISGLQQLKEQATTLSQHPGLDRDVGWMSYLPNLHGSKASDFHAQLQSLRANTALGVLNNLRSASKTGGGIGRVTNMEIGLFQNALGSLDESQSPEAFRGNLANVTKYADDAIKRLQQQKTAALAPAKPAGPAPQAGGNTSFNPQAVQMLKQNPSALARQQFDAVFGAGASKRALGAQ